jgi:hypothetical protein
MCTVHALVNVTVMSYPVNATLFWKWNLSLMKRAP